MMAFMAFSTSFAKASGDVDAVAVEVIAWETSGAGTSQTRIFTWQPITGELERNGMRWNRMPFHLIPFARTAGRGSTGHDGFG
jgi:hypothetical protein